MVLFVIQTKGPTYYIYLLSLEIDKDINAHVPVQINSESTMNCPPSYLHLLSVLCSQSLKLHGL